VGSKLEADVWFLPQVVIETIAAEITLSPIHTCGVNAIREGSGLALRFPRYTGRLRQDKGRRTPPPSRRSFRCNKTS